MGYKGLLVTATKIRAPDKGISSFLQDTSKLGQGRGRAKSLFPMASVPWDLCHQFLYVCQTRNLSLWQNLLDKQIGLFLRETNGVQCPGSGCLSRIVSIFIVSWDLGTQVPHHPASFQSQEIKVYSLGSSCKTKSSDIKTEVEALWAQHWLKSRNKKRKTEVEEK